MIASRKVFIVPGHDGAATQATAHFLAQLNLEPVIIRDLPSQGPSLIDRFDKYTDVSFAVVLLASDDLDSAKSPRARQDAVFELGFFVGRLGRKRVCAVYESEAEILSNDPSVLAVPMDRAGAWKLSLAKKIRAAGLPIDMNRVM